jgi:hypothetical protein
MIDCRGAHALVAVPQPAARGQRNHAMADRALAAGRSRRVWGRVRQLHGDRAAGRRAQAPSDDVAHQSRPPLRGTSTHYTYMVV